MYSRNQTTIASRCKHRQPVFLHPTVGLTEERPEAIRQAASLAPLADSASSLYTTSFPIHSIARPCVISPRTAGTRHKEGCMGRLRSNALRLLVAILSLWSFSGCGGGAKPGPPIF